MLKPPVACLLQSQICRLVIASGNGRLVSWPGQVHWQTSADSQDQAGPRTARLLLSLVEAGFPLDLQDDSFWKPQMSHPRKPVSAFPYPPCTMRAGYTEDACVRCLSGRKSSGRRTPRAGRVRVAPGICCALAEARTYLGAPPRLRGHALCFDAQLGPQAGSVSCRSSDVADACRALCPSLPSLR